MFNITQKYKKKEHPNIVITSKYTIWNFVPKNLYHQLRKGSTFFFFVTLIMLSIPSISPFEPWSYLMAFLMVTGISMIKDAVEDYKRHKGDFEINNKICKIICSNGIKEIKSMDLKVGDLLFVRKDQDITGDVVLLAGYKLDENVEKEGSKKKSGKNRKIREYCFIDTSNLDGETNLKKRFGIRKYTSTDEIIKFKKTIEKIKYEILSEDLSGVKCTLYTENNRSFSSEDDIEYEWEAHVDEKNARKESGELEEVTSNANFTEDVHSANEKTEVSRLDSLIIEFEKKNDLEINREKENTCRVKNDEKLIACDKNILLRGCRLKNTNKIVGLVVGVGDNIKQYDTSQKIGTSKFDQTIGYMMKMISILYCLMLVFTTGFGIVLHRKNIVYNDIIRLFCSSFIIYSYLIPLSLFVMLEVGRFILGSYISHDRSMVSHADKCSCDPTRSSVQNRYDGENTGIRRWIFESCFSVPANPEAEVFDSEETNNEKNTEIDLDDLVEKDVSNEENTHTVNCYKTSCRNTNIIEDIGLIDCILTDKTGTITKNMMILRYIHMNTMPNTTNNPSIISDVNSIVKDQKIDIDNFKECFSGLDVKNAFLKNDKRIMFLINILVCNSVELINEMEYQGVSQDELCFLNYLKKYDIQILRKNDDFIEVSIFKVKFSFKIVTTIEFISKHQCMSIVVKPIFNEKNEKKDSREIGYYLLKKGSDQVMVADPPQELKAIWVSDPNLRTLVFGCRRLKRSEIKKIYGYIKNKNGENNIEKAESYINNLETEYLGTTFIEDKLEDSIPEIFELIQSAGIKIWVITGDKKETAKACSVSAGIRNNYLLKSATDLLEMTSLQSVSENEDPIEKLLNKYSSAVIYRATPKQKGEISRMISSRITTIGIGDGSNDIQMIKESSVGIGIYGKEGNQAALCGDFSLPKFRMLKELLFLHGHYNFLRFSKVTINSFRKNLQLITIQFIFNFFNRSSGKSIFNFFFMNYFNLIFSSLIPVSILLFDRDHPHEFLISNPNYYMSSRTIIDLYTIAIDFGFSIFVGSVIFLIGFISMGTMKDVINLVTILLFYSVIIRQIRTVDYWVSYTYILLVINIILFGFVIDYKINYIVFYGISIIFIIDSIHDYINKSMLINK